MRLLLAVLAALTAAGCAGSGRHGIAYTDPYDDIRVEQMSGNHVSGRVLERTLVCLNARRESRLLTTVTNQTVTFVTNVVVVPVTNLVVTLTTNTSRTVATNQVPPTPILATPEGDTTNTPALTAPVPVPVVTNITVTAGSNHSLSRAANQTITTANHQTLTSTQVTLTTNQWSVTTADNVGVTADTNLVVTLVTNMNVLVLTNTVILATNRWVRDYFLTVEYTPPPEFSLAGSGESLALLVDGHRYGLLQAAPQAAFVARRGFQAAVYRASPELLVDLANAKQARLRLRGNNAVIEKDLNRSSLSGFRSFVRTHFTPPPASPPPALDQPIAGLTHPLP